PFFDGNNYGHWKAKMTIFIQALDFNLWDIIIDGPELPHTVSKEGVKTFKPRSLYTDDDRKKVQLNAKAKHVIICALNSNEFNRVSSCATAKEMWDRLEVTYEGTNQVKDDKINMLVREYKMLSMKENETISSMFVRFTNIINSVQSLNKCYTNSEMVRKIIRRFKRFLAKKKFDSKSHKKPIPSKIDTKKEEIICFECNKPGHYKSECPRLKKAKETIKKKKSMLAT
ncbi:LOW QUALITY PROTEIN: zf-CCHC domain-containing protein/DUF4219 domain-containing protein/UBN2 domain-containing protein, partial [Cephalotus follicularis]